MHLYCVPEFPHRLVGVLLQSGGVLPRPLELDEQHPIVAQKELTIGPPASSAAVELYGVHAELFERALDDGALDGGFVS